jgi:2-C-methyl-D-erythritol 4-phosphate cytidylyltransferase
MSEVIIVGAGASTRMKGINKLMIKIEGKTVIEKSIEAFQKVPSVEKIVLVSSESNFAFFNELSNNYSKIFDVVKGGKERQDSVYNGLKALEKTGESIVMIHDGARPFISREIIEKAEKECEDCDAAVVAVKAKNTIKMVRNGFVEKTLDRSLLWEMQTPQVIKKSIAFNAFKKAFEEGFYGTDDVQLVERVGGKVKIIEGSYDNIKITTPEDVKIAEIISTELKKGELK